MFKNVNGNLSNVGGVNANSPSATSAAATDVPKKSSVSSLASIASSVDNSSPYIRLMTDSERRKRSSESQGSNESFHSPRNRKVSESPSQIVGQIDEMQSIPMQEFIPTKSPKLDKKGVISKRTNLVPIAFSAKAKVQNFQAGGGSKVFANYTAQIKERSAQNQATNQLLQIPTTTLSSPAHPVRRGSMNDILGQNSK